MLRLLLVMFTLAIATAPASSAAARRLAFVVGIDLYDNLPAEQQLKRAVSDARTMTSTLRALQFDIVDGSNLGREAFYLAWQRFLGELAPGDTAAMFFAGHGVEMRGANYLMPRDVPRPEKGELVLRSAAVPLVELLDALDEKKPATALVVLDACRDNPFTVSGRSVGGTRGLARVDERPGTLILYSAGIGQRALDHVPGEPTATNSVFTHTLVPLLRTRGLSLLDVAVQTQRRVDALVRRESHAQTPAFYSQLLTDVYLAGAPAAPSAMDSSLPRPGSDTAAAEAARKATEAEVARRVATEKARLEVELAAQLARAEAERKRSAEAAPATSPPIPVIEPKRPDASPSVAAPVHAGRLVRALPGHDQNVYSVAISPDGRIIATASGPNVRLWDAAGGTLIRTLPSHRSTVYALAFSPDGRRIVSGDYTVRSDHGVRVTEVATGKQVRSITLPVGTKAGGWIEAIVVSPDSRWIVGGTGDGRLHVWELETGRKLRSIIVGDSGIKSIAMSPDGRWIVSGSILTGARVWEAATGQPGPTIEKAEASVAAVAVSQDGQWLVGGRSVSTVDIWELATGRHVRSIDSSGSLLQAVAVSRDGRFIASGGSNSVVDVREVATGRLIRELGPNGHKVRSLAISPDDRTIVIGGCEREEGMACIEGFARIWQ